MMLDNGILAHLLDYTLLDIFHGNKNQFARALDFDRHYVRTVINKVRNGENSDKLRENLLAFFFANETYSLDKIRSNYLSLVRNTGSGCIASGVHFEQYINSLALKANDTQGYRDIYLELDKHCERLREEFCVVVQGKPIGVGCDSCQFVLIKEECPLKVIFEYANWIVACQQKFDSLG